MPSDQDLDFTPVGPIPPAAALEYRVKSSQLVAHVDRALIDDPRREELTGGGPLSVAFDNHRNHGQFVANVLSLNHLPLLARLLPWVYRAYSARGFSVDYFPFVLRSFRDAVERHLTPAATAPVAAVYTRALALHERILLLAGSAPPEPPADSLWLGRAPLLADVLLSGDARRALALTGDWVVDAGDLPPFLELTVTAAMIEVGRRWELAEISEAQEHLATALANRVLASLYPRIVTTSPWRGPALVTCPANELHELGARVFADLLELDGWDVRFLGANTPWEALLATLRATDFRFLALSTTMPFNLDQVAETVARCRSLSGPHRPPVLLGGRAFALAPSLWREVGGDAYCATAGEGVTCARAWSASGTEP